MQGKRVKILMAKMGLDCHDTGIVTMTQMLRDAGCEVIYLGLHNSAERILRVAMEEDVDIIGLSFLSGQHMVQTAKLLDLMKKEGADFPIMVGGVIPSYDVKQLHEMGVSKVFSPGTMTSLIMDFIDETTKASA